MTLLRLLVPLVVVVLLVWWFFGRRRREPTARPGADKSASGLPASIVACAHCGVHFPREDALPDADGRLFCCEAHRDAAGR